jgi:hypothetical protein
VWATADEFRQSRTFTRFEPTKGVNIAKQGLAGWRRAVRATVRWARDREE